MVLLAIFHFPGYLLQTTYAITTTELFFMKPIMDCMIIDTFHNNQSISLYIPPDRMGCYFFRQTLSVDYSEQYLPRGSCVEKIVKQFFRVYYFHHAAIQCTSSLQLPISLSRTLTYMYLIFEYFARIKDQNFLAREQCFQPNIFGARSYCMYMYACRNDYSTHIHEKVVLTAVCMIDV